MNYMNGINDNRTEPVNGFSAFVDGTMIYSFSQKEHFDSPSLR